MAVFEVAAFDHIAPDILQPPDIFLERSGEDIRANSYVFTDPEGHEMCLRTHLTVAACRSALAHAVNNDSTLRACRYHVPHPAKLDKEARYCYCGPAFRFTENRRFPSEFGQAGIEW